METYGENALDDMVREGENECHSNSSPIHVHLVLQKLVFMQIRTAGFQGLLGAGGGGRGVWEKSLIEYYLKKMSCPNRKE